MHQEVEGGFLQLQIQASMVMWPILLYKRFDLDLVCQIVTILSMKIKRNGDCRKCSVMTSSKKKLSEGELILDAIDYSHLILILCPS